MRLIDADKLTEQDFYDRIDGSECMDVINDQPTAYDIEAVIGQLEKCLGNRCPDGFVERLCPAKTCEDCQILYAIEVVKAGGRDE